MSFKRGWNAINLIMTDKIPHTQFISNDEFILKKTGIDTSSLEVDELSMVRTGYSGRKRLLTKTAMANALDYDILWNSHQVPIKEGRITEMGHATWGEVDKKKVETSCPFKTIEDVLKFDPMQEYKMPDVNTIAGYFQNHLNEIKKLCPDTVITGGRYDTLFSACIRTFGWEIFLSSVPKNEKEFDKILEGFLEISLLEVQAWLKTNIKVYLSHDDIAWTTGPIFKPEWYKKYIFPKYKRLWKSLKDNGLIVLYCSDGNFTEFVDDIANAGADGFIFEPITSLEYIVKKYGKTKVIIGNADCRILQFGTENEIKQEVKRCIDLGRDCPGYFMSVGNHIPNGIPIKNIDYFFKCFEKFRNR